MAAFEPMGTDPVAAFEPMGTDLCANSQVVRGSVEMPVAFCSFFQVVHGYGLIGIFIGFCANFQVVH